MATNKKVVYVGMSGGVDSSVSALILKEQGYRVVGVYMKNWSKDLPGMKCPWAEDLADAKRVAVKLGIDFEVWDFEKEYYQKVVEYMLDEFKKGNTPNPDIMCNQEIKFKLFYEKARQAGADYIATGHYARVIDISNPFATTGANGEASPVTTGASDEGREMAVALARAVDENKDQTYFLYRISDEALRHTIFPIGEMLKPDVKKLAEKNGLHNAYKKESMGVCFVGEVGMKDFLKEYIEVKPGEIREIETGKILGYHEGVVFYTIGQRHGLYLDGEKGVENDGLPYYVVKKDVKENVVYVSKNLNHEAIWTKELKLKNIFLRQKSLNSVKGNTTKSNVLVRLRHRAPLVKATFDGKTLHFENEIKRPAAGQSAVLYDGEVCLGGGIITE
ncbi:tRNA 2-thiouridine(34) synthase MnmA [Candidatus Saccharibacteria bacterium]|nr:tRNA 2-thiouridine(34) synthase MnmA [Candidatus Saccharibacteria bacterium]